MVNCKHTEVDDSLINPRIAFYLQLVFSQRKVVLHSHCSSHIATNSMIHHRAPKISAINRIPLNDHKHEMQRERERQREVLSTLGGGAKMEVKI